MLAETAPYRLLSVHCATRLRPLPYATPGVLSMSTVLRYALPACICALLAACTALTPPPALTPPAPAAAFMARARRTRAADRPTAILADHYRAPQRSAGAPGA